MGSVQPTRAVACVGCRGMVPDVEGPTHPYMQASPGCWQLYGELGASAATALGGSVAGRVPR